MGSPCFIRWWSSRAHAHFVSIGLKFVGSGVKPFRIATVEPTLAEAPCTPKVIRFLHHGCAKTGSSSWGGCKPRALTIASMHVCGRYWFWRYCHARDLITRDDCRVIRMHDEKK